MVLTYFTKEELITQLKLQFDSDEQQNIDFNQFTMTETVKGFVVKIVGRSFLVHKTLGVVIDEL